MRRRHSLVVCLVAGSLALSAAVHPAFANGLIPTERLAAPAPTAQADASAAADRSGSQRAGVEAALIQAGVEAAHARARVAALTDAEIASLDQRIATLPAGGVWFMPFLLVAAVIGVLIGTRDSTAGPRPATSTDLFGHPRAVANNVP